MEEAEKKPSSSDTGIYWAFYVIFYDKRRGLLPRTSEQSGFLRWTMCMPGHVIDGAVQGLFECAISIAINWEKMGPSPILSVTYAVTIGTMLNFDGGNKGHGIKNVTFSFSTVDSQSLILVKWASSLKFRNMLV